MDLCCSLAHVLMSPLQALHVEKCGLEALPAGLHLLHCKMLRSVP